MRRGDATRVTRSEAGAARSELGVEEVARVVVDPDYAGWMWQWGIAGGHRSLAPAAGRYEGPPRPGFGSGVSSGGVAAWIRRQDVVGARLSLDSTEARARRLPGEGWLAGEERKAAGWAGAQESAPVAAVGEEREVARWWGGGETRKIKLGMGTYDARFHLIYTHPEDAHNFGSKYCIPILDS
ncbi:hypothetical protein VPH35_037542 [Triticum aestivum]|uniref:Uncharacterized protein n=1 Tax=Aegilops tauschii TaxID=37682 RepID=M8BFY3_AEGTA